MRRFVVGVGIGLLALGAGLAGSVSPGLAQAGGEGLPSSTPSSTRSLAQEIGVRLDSLPAPEVTPRAFDASPGGPTARPSSRERLHRAVQRAGEEVRRVR